VDGGVVTVVSVIVAGVLSPWIAGQIASRAQTQRLDHERALHDLEDLRREVDQLADLFGDLIRATTAFLNTDADDDEARIARHVEVRRVGGLVMERTARLKIRLPADDELVRVAKVVLDRFDAVISDSVSGSVTDDEIDERMAGVGDANTAFFRAANERIGARIENA
jgi:hypothetical protein